MVTNLKLTDKVIFLSRRNDIIDLINIFDIYIAPSLFESIPLTVLENQVNGKKVYMSSNITQLSKISNRACFIDLDKGYKKWAKIIACDESNSNLVLDYKYDIRNYCKMIANIYENND